MPNARDDLDRLFMDLFLFPLVDTMSDEELAELTMACREEVVLPADVLVDKYFPSLRVGDNVFLAELVSVPEGRAVVYDMVQTVQAHRTKKSPD